jgi:uncharacterized protein (DUF58 family)
VTAVARLLSPDDIRRLANLHVTTRTRVEGFCSGLHRSPHKGFSVEFREHRAYAPGDELRRLDWKLFGRRDRFFIREFEEETNVRAMLLLDASGSMGYGDGSGLTKFDYAARMAAGLSWLLLQQSDAVGLVTFDTQLRQYIPPRSRPGHLKVLAETILDTTPGGETSLGKVFHDLAVQLHRRGLLIILSDCFDSVADILSALAHFRHAHHEVVVLQIWHPDELEFPFRGWVRFDSLERAGHRQFLDPAMLREAYQARVRQFQEELRRGCYRHRVDLASFVMDRPPIEALANYLSGRVRRT